MTVYNFTQVLVWDNLGGSVKVARNQRVNVTDPSTGAVAPGLTVNGQPVSFVTSDSNGHVSFAATIGTVTLTGPNGFSMNFQSPDAYVQATQAAADAASAKDSAAQSAQSAQDSANLVNAPAGTAVDTRLGSGVGLSVAATASVADVQAALDNAAANGQRAVAYGTLTTSTTLLIKSDCDLSQLTINYTGTGTAVQIGSSATGHIHRINVRLGRIVYTSKPAGASWVAGSIGVEVRNVFRSNIDYVLIQDFETGLKLVGDGSYGGLGGVAYNTLRCGSLANNFVNQSLQLVSGTVTPFVNENTYIGGSWSHADGTYPQTGMRQILIGTTGGGSLNNNRWIGCSLESVREEYILDVYGNDNLWVGCRWETSGHNPPVRWRPTAARNLIVGGYQVNELAVGQVVDSGASANNIIGTNTFELATTSDGGMILSALSGGTTSPLTVMRANWRQLGDTTAANYIVKLAAGGKLRFKNSSDTSDRFSVDYVNRTITLGAGINTSASGIYWGTGSPEGAITAPQGATFYNYGAGSTGFGQYVKSTGTGNTGWHSVGFQNFTTASRPAASLAGAGGCYFDTTLNKPGWSDGTNWRDATGATI